MPIRCTFATETQIEEWTKVALKAKAKADITIVYDDAAQVAVFQSADGFYFRRGPMDAAVRTELTTESRDYLCSPFELTVNPKEGKADPNPLLQRFEDLYGRKARQIDTHLFVHNGTTLLLALFPSSVVREMMAPHGGLLKTVFKGRTQDLRHIPALQHFLHFPDEDTYVESVFATRYEKGNYEAVRALHYQIVKDVIEIKRDRGGPISLGPIAQWDA
jgi:hypothetical protein